MSLKLVLGPMKSGKSLELIRVFSPLSYSNTKWVVLQSSLHQREIAVASRAGGELATQKVSHIRASKLEGYDVIGIDEVHMFDAASIAELGILLKAGKRVVAAGLDLDYRGRLMKNTRLLLELGPTSVEYLSAACEVCRQPGAQFSQVLHNAEPITGGLPSILPEDGSYEFQARCRRCFVRA